MTPAMATTDNRRPMTDRASRTIDGSTAMDLDALMARLREATTVLDEPYHREAVADTMTEVADALTRLWAAVKLVSDCAVPTREDSDWHYLPTSVVQAVRSALTGATEDNDAA